MSNIREKAEEAWLDYRFRAGRDLYGTCFKDAYMQGAAEALRSQWVSVEEELPEFDKEVLLICEYGSSLGYLDSTNMWLADGFGEVFNVTHWMPIPPLPEARKEGEV